MTSNNDRYTMVNINDAQGTNYCGITLGSFSATNKITSTTYFTYTADMNYITFKDNVYNGSLSTNGKSLI